MPTQPTNASSVILRGGRARRADVHLGPTRYTRSDTPGVGGGPTPATMFGADLVHWWSAGYNATSGVFTDGGSAAADAFSTDVARKPAAGVVNGHVSASFDGNDCIEAGDLTTVDGATATIFFGCFKGVPAQNTYAVILGKLYGGVAFHIGANSTGDRLVASVGSAFAVGDATSNADPFDGGWHRFIFVWEESVGGVLYLDGVAQTIQQAPNVGIPDVPDCGEPIALGGCSSVAGGGGAYDYHFTGEANSVGIVVDRVPTGPETTALDSYLATWISGSFSSPSVPSTAIDTSMQRSLPTGADVFLYPGLDDEPPPAPGAVVLEGTADGLCATAASQLAVRRSVAATATGVCTTASAAMRRNRSLAATATGVCSTAAAQLRTTRRLVGTATGAASTAAAQAKVARALAGTATGSSTATATMRVRKALVGTATGSATAQAHVRVARPLAGTAAGLCTTTGALRVARRLVGTATGVCSTTATLRASRPLAGVSTGQTTTTAHVRATRPLGASSAGVATASASISRPVDLAGSAAGVCTTASAQLRTARGFVATAGGQATADAALRALRAFGATADGQAGATAEASNIVQFAGTCAGTSTAIAEFTSAVPAECRGFELPSCFAQAVDLTLTGRGASAVDVTATAQAVDLTEDA